MQGIFLPILSVRVICLHQAPAISIVGLLIAFNAKAESYLYF